MNRAIADRAAEIGADAEGFNADERLEAVAAQLARLSREMEPHGSPPRESLRAPAQDERADEFWAAARPKEADRVRVGSRPAAPRFQPAAPPRPRLAGGRDGAGAEALLEQAVAAFQQQAGRVEAGAARAMANVATLIESTRSLRADALAQVDARLAEIEQKLLRGGEVSLKPLQDMIASVQDRLAEIETRLPKAASHDERGPGPGEDPALRQIDSRLAALLGRLEKSEAGRLEAPPEKPFAGLEQRFDALLARLDHAPTRVAPASPRRGLHGAISEIAARQRDLDATSAPLPAPAAREDKRIDRLQEGVEVLSGRFESMRREFAAAASSVEIETLARQVAAMSRALEDVAPRDRMESLENAVLALGERIESSRRDGMREGVLAPIEALAGELRRAVAEAGAAANFDGVARQLRDVEDKIELFRGTMGVDRADFLKIREQSDHLRAAIAAAVEQLEPLRRIERQVADLSEKLEQVAHLARDAGQARQEGLAQGSAGWRGVESRLDDLAQRIERVVGERASAPEGEDSRFDDLSRRLDFVHQALASRIDDARAEARSQTLSQNPPTPPSLEPLLRALAEKLDTAAAPQADARALEALERQVAQVSERLDSADPGIGARLERAIEDLAQRFESAREAERDAARQAFRETLAEWPFPARDEEASREIADLREKQNASDRRAQQTLSAVHETLEKVVDRLAMLEDDVLEGRGGDRRDATAPAAEAPATRPLAPSYDFDDADFLREPGAGRPGARRDAGTDAPEVEAEPAAKPAKTNYIDVARRAIAARAAAEKAEADATGPHSEAADDRSAFVRPRALGEASGARRLPALLVTAAAVLALGAVQAYRLFDTAPPPMQSVIEPDASAAAPSATGNAASQLPAPASARAPVAPASPPDATAPGSAQGSAPGGDSKPAPGGESKPLPGGESKPLPAGDSKPLPAGARIDPLPVGTVPPRANALEAAPAAAQIAILRQMADKGDAAAQYDLAARLAEGRGVDRDLAASVSWFEKAAAQGLAQAQYRLGALYEKGSGVPRDLARARGLYEKAATQGNVRAMHNLAVIEAEGVDSKPDYAAAANWFRRAAEFGVRDSQFNLAILYARGMGVSLDLSQSYVWFAIAARQGDEDAAKKRDEIAARLDARTLEAAKKQAADFHAQTPAGSTNDPPAAAIRPTALFTGPAMRAAAWSRF
jgi:localization factor PodJL